MTTVPVPVPQGEPLFVYGTLMFPEVLEVLLARTPAMEVATLDGWRAAALADRVYPGLVAAPAPGAVDGRLLLDLDADEYEVLDAFEDVLYERRILPLADGRPAMTYVWLDDALVLPHDWDAEAFVTDHLPTYVAHWSDWRRTL